MGASLKRIRESGNDGEDRTEQKQDILRLFNMLNEEGQEKAREYMQDLAGVKRYQRTEGETKNKKIHRLAYFEE
jgi:hypothetical protein